MGEMVLGIADRKAIALLLGIILFAYGYFFQGTGWNQNAHFDTIRALVEHRSADITAYAENTGDVSYFDGRIYSNKPPGLALLGAPVYWLAITLERVCSADPMAPQWVLRNMHLVTFVVSAIPGALVALGIYALVRREEKSVRLALLLAGALAFGSLNWAYAGVMMNHLTVAAALIWAWYFISEENQGISVKRSIRAGALLGLALVCDYSVAPLIVLFLAYLMWQRTSITRMVQVCIGPALAALIIAGFNRWAFGSILATTYSYEDAAFTQPGLLFGQFGWPQWERLYWISYQRMRGLFVCCPMFMVPVLSLVTPTIWRKGSWTAKGGFPLLLIGYFIVFMLTFYGWTGGWSVGPRYMIPALPFIWLYAPIAWRRLPRVCGLLVVLSIATMLTIVSVRVLHPANISGPPREEDPVSVSWLGFIGGQFAKSPDSYNLGIAMGLPGRMSIVPVVLAIGCYFFFALHWRERADSDPALAPLSRT